MASYEVNTVLPKCIINALVEKGATVRKDCGIHVIECVSEILVGEFLSFLGKEEEVKCDPLLVPLFGPPLAQYVSPNVQAEVHYLLHSFQPLLRAAFHPGGVIPVNPMNPAFIPPLGGYQFHHAQIAIQKVQQEITNPQHFVAQCPFLAGLNGGYVICDLNIHYANCVVVQKLRKV